MNYFWKIKKKKKKFIKRKIATERLRGTKMPTKGEHST